jgi:cytochrome b561
MDDEAGDEKVTNRLLDQPDSFGWVSIWLHWTTAALVVVLWFIGQSIDDQAIEVMDTRRGIHVSVAVTAWLLLLVRIVWRVSGQHPRATGQSRIVHRVAKVVHYTMLIAIAVMMISGPAFVWAHGDPTAVFGYLQLPVAVKEQVWIAGMAYTAHSTSSKVLAALVLIHVGGALKHMMFHEDDTIVRMLWPKT